MIEVEVRGGLNSKDFEKTIEVLKKKAKFIEIKNRLTLAYFKRSLTKDCREVKNEKVDLRLRITNKKAEMILKYGLWGAKDKRKEISIPIESDKFDDAVEMLGYLDWNKCLLATATTRVFDYKGIEFAIVKQNNKDCYFEAEKITENIEEAEKIHNEIEKACREEGFFDFINQLNKSVIFLDFSKDSWKETKKKFLSFF
jgi:adenylate cyclase class IV